MKLSIENWRQYQSALIPDVPPHNNINLEKDEIKQLHSYYNPLFIRWTNQWDTKEPTQFWYIIKDKFEELESLSSNTRSKIRRGLKRNSIEKVNAKFIIENGYEVYEEAFSRYNTFIKKLSKEEFVEMLKKQEDKGNFHFWAVINKPNEQLVGFSLNAIQENTVNYSIIKYHPKFLKDYISYALIYKMNEYYLKKMDYLYVNDGTRSISHETNIQKFLLDKFHFRKAYCKLNISYRKDVWFIITSFYPLRKVISKINTKLTKKLAVLLKQEEIRRSFK